MERFEFASSKCAFPTLKYVKSVQCLLTFSEHGIRSCSHFFQSLFIFDILQKFSTPIVQTWHKNFNFKISLLSLTSSSSSQSSTERSSPSWKSTLAPAPAGGQGNTFLPFIIIIIPNSCEAHFKETLFPRAKQISRSIYITGLCCRIICSHSAEKYENLVWVFLTYYISTGFLCP